MTAAEKRALKARAQVLEPVVRLGHEGASEGFYRALAAALQQHQLVKVKFADFQEDRKTLAPAIASHSGSELIMQVGHVAVFYQAPSTAAPG